MVKFNTFEMLAQKMKRREDSLYLSPSCAKITTTRLSLGFLTALALLASACSSIPSKTPEAQNSQPAQSQESSLDQFSEDPSEAQPAETDASDQNQNLATSLSQKNALARAGQVEKVSYTLWFGLDALGSEFSGRTVILFDLKPKAKKASRKLQIDLEGGTIHSLLVNGKQLSDFSSPERFDGHHITFDLDELDPSGNRIEISYTHPYSTNGSGLHRFEDPVDKNVYLYSDFEPYDAHLMFPCFDQPDLKASYELTVEAPKSWQVIANMPEREITQVEGVNSWIFPPSPVISTYVFALHAGPYTKWKDEANGIPLGLFARKSLAKYVDVKEWFEITKQGLQFFGTHFGIPYPFPKYDQLLVPDFNAGAMENVGAVTFTERAIYRTKVTQDRRRGRADTILHEMAHMWFGNLVTMKWWNGLWLNESFATFMASLAVEEATRFNGSWQAFFTGIKEWAYWEDQLVTTHPIEVPVSSTDRAESIFDGITYGKGASTLKQLSYYLGPEYFREGIQRYFQRYAYRNTTLDNFIQMLEEASDIPLSNWQQQWLRTDGVNTLKADWACEPDPKKPANQILSHFDLIQSSEKASRQSTNTLRPHKTQIALYYLPKARGRSTQALKPKTKLNVTYHSEVTSVDEFRGQSCPDFAFPNYADHDYVKMELSSKDRQFLQGHLHQLADPLVRQMVWHSLWEMVIDGKMKAQKYADLAFDQLPRERDTLIVGKVLGDLASSTARGASVLRYVDPSLRPALQIRIEAFLKKNLLLSPPGSDLQLIWYHRFLGAASTRDSIQWVRDILSRKSKISGIPLDQERKWELVETLARAGAPDAAELISQQLKADPTDNGEKHAIAAEAMIPTKASKQKWLFAILNRFPADSEDSVQAPPHQEGAQNTLENPDPLPVLNLAKMREAMRTYHLLGQEQFTIDSIEGYAKTLPALALSKSAEKKEYAKWLAKLMYPSTCSLRTVQMTTTLLKSYPHLPSSVAKALRVGRQEERRCMRARIRSIQKKGNNHLAHQVTK